MNKTGTAGNQGKDVRSDCFVEFSRATSGGHNIDLKSKVEVIFGKSIRKLVKNILNHFEIEHANVIIEDAGALEFVLAARIEAAIKNDVKLSLPIPVRKHT